MKPDSYKIAIAESHYLILHSLQMLLGEAGRYQVVDMADVPTSLASRIQNKQFDLLIVDPAQIGYNQLDVLQELKLRMPELKVLILTNNLSKQELTELTKIGIRNILLKKAGKEEIMRAVVATLHGKRYFSEEILDRLTELSENKATTEEPARLTSSEIEIVRMIANGMSTKEIADTRFISYHTVNTHRKNIFRKLEVTNSSELIMYAIKSGWIDNIEYFI